MSVDANNLETSFRTARELGAFIRSVRKAQGLTQLDVAFLAGMSNRFIIDLERGKETLQIQKVFEVMSLLGLEVNVRRVR